MSLTGDLKSDLQILEKLKTPDILKLLESHNLRTTLLVIKDSGSRSTEHKKILAQWIIQNRSFAEITTFFEMTHPEVTNKKQFYYILDKLKSNNLTTNEIEKLVGYYQPHLPRSFSDFALYCCGLDN